MIEKLHQPKALRREAGRGEGVGGGVETKEEGGRRQECGCRKSIDAGAGPLCVQIPALPLNRV